MVNEDMKDTNTEKLQSDILYDWVAVIQEEEATVDTFFTIWFIQRLIVCQHSYLDQGKALPFL